MCLETTIDEGLTDIVESRYNAGIQFSEEVAKDMIAVRVSPDVRAAFVGSITYFADCSIPNIP